MNDGCVLFMAALRDGGECTCADFFQALKVIFLHLPAIRAREFFHTRSIVTRGKFIWRQHGEFACEDVAFGYCARLGMLIV